MIALDLIVLIPLVAALACALFGRRHPGAARWVALAAVVGQGIALASLSEAGVFAGERVVGVQLGAAPIWSLVTDGLSTPLVVLTVIVGLMAISASWNVDDRPGAHFALLALLQAAVSLVFLAESLVLFYIAWESVLIPMFLLIGGWGSKGARRAATKFLIFTFAGGVVLLAGVIYALVVGGTDSILLLTAQGGLASASGVLFWLLAVGFLVKLPAIPLHTWLPDAHTEAPTAGSIVLAGVMLKMAGYGLIRLALPLDPRGFAAAAPVLIGLGILGIVWGAATALVQSDLKRLVAYSSVAHMGFVLVAIGIGTPASLSAALVTMVSHGLVAGLLFYLVGALYGRAHTRDIARFGGLGSVTPRWAVAFVFFSLASAGLPGLSGFPGELVTTVESFSAVGWWTLLIGLGVVMAAAYNLRAVRATVQGTPGEFAELPDLDVRETASAALVGLVTVVVGMAPWLITSSAMGALQPIADLVGKVAR